MIRKVAEFYLWGMGLAFLITLIVGAQGAATTEVFFMAMLAWPLAALLMLAKRSYGQIRSSQQGV